MMLLKILTVANRQVLEALYLTGAALKDFNDNAPYLLVSQVPTDVTPDTGQLNPPEGDTYLTSAGLTEFENNGGENKVTYLRYS